MKVQRVSGLAQALICAVCYLAAAFSVSGVSPFSIEGSAMAAMSLGTSVVIYLGVMTDKLYEASQQKSYEVTSIEQRLRYIERRLMNSEMAPYELLRQITNVLSEWDPATDQSYGARKTIHCVSIWMRSFFNRFRVAPSEQLLAFLVQLSAEQSYMDGEKRTLFWEKMREQWPVQMRTYRQALNQFSLPRQQYGQLQMTDNEELEMSGFCL